MKVSRDMQDNTFIHLEDVTFTYPGGEKPVLKNVSLSIERGDFVALIGGNGSGKTTLCKTLNGLIPHYYVGDFSGTVMVNGVGTTQAKVAEMSKHVGYVYQDFENQIIRPTVLDDASFAPLNYGIRSFREQGQKALQLTGLQQYASEFVWQLSGGQKHLLALASAMSLDPDILIIDEPVAQLDPQHARDIYDILKTFNEREQKTIIVIEHHTEFIAEYCKHVVLMDDGEVIWQKRTKEALSQVDELMSRHIYPPQVTQAAHRLNYSTLPVTLDEAVQQFRCPPKGNRDHALLKQRLKTEAVIEIMNVSFSYKTVNRTRKQVLEDISISFNKGERVALVGNNGAGKSSLMRLITGLTKPDQGQVMVKGINTRESSPETLAELVTFIYQNPEQMFIDDSVRKDVEFFLKARNISGYQQRVDDILARFRLTDLQERDGRLMSGGQQRRASLAIGVAMNPAVMLLDEPTANLDMATRKDILETMNQLEGQVETVILATHDMELVAEWANRIIVMSNGQILHDGNRDSVFGDPDLLAQAGLVPPQILELSQVLNLERLCYTVEDFVALQKEETANGVCSQTVG
ncbi:energy-coupling factor transporter ATPase [Halalkalibacter urbisdiaboli]|uniref:ABC transporter ATP-binding protein n=1 Tax=Halalkalibacter urbisdiaboli TaxID=1960589 RepID=UPI00315A7720